MRVTRWMELVLIVLLVAWVGCGGSKQEVGTVHGRVTLDGQPLAHATVEFRVPGKPTGGGSTDENGNYELIFKRGVKGAPVGMNRVVIEEDTQVTHHPQRVPARYNESTELQREVKPGDNVIDFDLTTEQSAAKK